VPSIAVIADPHFHDIANRQGSHRAPLAAVRTLADTMESTRVFNESYRALPTLLDDIVSRGISLVVIAGDLSDDGQTSTMAAAAALLADYSARHGLRFFATPGNHDLYAIHGRHQSKRFLNADGTHALVTSDATAPQGASVETVVTQDMHCGGYAETLAAMAPFGFFRRPEFLHWETPFGASDDLGTRCFEIVSKDGRTRRRMIDASYLVEPEKGLWLLSIDANVFEPRNGDLDPAAESSYIDSTDAGWNSMLQNKPFILGWMKDVAVRAKALGKRLLTFSHYPAIDPLGGTAAQEAKLLGDTNFVRRTPAPVVAETVAATGVGIHFSGHLHINDTAVFRSGSDFLVNISVPSMVGFPSAYKLVDLGPERLKVRTITIADVPGFDAAFGLYQAEAKRDVGDTGDLLDAASHIDFLSRHLAAMVRHRYLPREWPQDLARLVPLLSLADLAGIAGVARPLRPQEVEPGKFRVPRAVASDDIGFFDMVVDWYRLRKGRELALDFVPADRLAAYRRLARRYAAVSWPSGSLQSRLASFLAILDSYLASQPSRNFSVDLATGEVTADPDGYLALTDLRQTNVA
jgi:3',5'-cyclic AMP phosphodiesterase CpdA